MTWLWVAIGGAIGACGRHSLGVMLPSRWVNLPLATTTVNLTGCVAIGVLMAYVDLKGSNAWSRHFLMTGLLGGWTTFSAFGADGLRLLREQAFVPLLMFVLIQVLGGLVLVWLGFNLTKTWLA